MSSGLFFLNEHNVLGAAVDLAHFETIVNAMLAWSDEPKAPKKVSGRSSAPAVPRVVRDELDDDEEEEIVDDDDFEPEEEIGIKADAGAAEDDDLDEADLAAGSPAAV